MNTIHTELVRLLEQVPPGPRLEIGVHRGDSLKLIADHDRLTVGVDSFEGMGDPSEYDIHPDGRSEYPRGRLKVDFAKVNSIFSQMPKVMLIKGWVPQILAVVPDVKYTFVHVDLDHYVPSKAAIEWCWSRMRVGGILCCDDWFPDRIGMFASRAIHEIAQEKRPVDGEIPRKAFWRF